MITVVFELLKVPRRLALLGIVVIPAVPVIRVARPHVLRVVVRNHVRSAVRVSDEVVEREVVCNFSGFAALRFS